MPHVLGVNSLEPDQARAAADLAADIAARLGAARARLTRLARLRGVPADQAEDVVQETLLTAWRSLDRLRDAQRFDAWLDGILRNYCRRYAVALEEEAAAPLSALEDFDAPAEEVDPLDELSQRELATLIDAALGHLRENARQALELRYLAELPSEEVAARLGLTLNALDLRLSRARRQLRETLSGPLRERAVEFGLALAPADEHGWRDSRLWCHFCGRARLLGILEDAPDGGGRMALRCPRCYRETGATETDIDSVAAIQGLSSFRSATKRLMRLGFERIPPTLRHEAPCYVCGTPLRARVVSGPQIAVMDALVDRYPQHFYIVSDCRVCGPHIHGAAVIAAGDAPDIMRFVHERQRLVVEPEELTAYDGAPAIRFSLCDLATGERIIYFADPQTLDLRGVHFA